MNLIEFIFKKILFSYLSKVYIFLCVIIQEYKILLVNINLTIIITISGRNFRIILILVLYYLTYSSNVNNYC